MSTKVLNPNLKLFLIVVSAIVVGLVAFTIGKSLWDSREAAIAQEQAEAEAAARQAQQQMQKESAQKYIEDFMSQATTKYYKENLRIYPQDYEQGFPKPEMRSLETTWRSDATLHLIVATPWHSASSWPYFCFFFVDGNLVGNAAFPSGVTIDAQASDDTTIAIVYNFYKQGEPLCCPSGKATIRFQWDGANFVALDEFQPSPYFDPQSFSSFLPKYSAVPYKKAPAV